MKIGDVARWEAEVRLAEGFRNEEFGQYNSKQVTRAGELLNYYEYGFSTEYLDNKLGTGDYCSTATLNLIHSLVKNVLPSLYFKNPKVLVQPKRKVDEESSPFAQEILNYYYQEINADKQNRKVLFDSYLLGMGIYKVGYATKFGMDIPDEKAKKKKVKDRILETVGLKKPTEEESTRPEINNEILAESPYIQWISPFNFLIDPRATSLDDAMWVAHVVEKNVDEIKSNKMFKNTRGIHGNSIEEEKVAGVNIPTTDIDAFKKVKLYEIHYRSDDGFYLTYICKDGDVYKELYHEKSIYDLDEWQFDILDFSGHSHRLYKLSEMMKIKNLQDRFTSTMDNILEQLDSFVPKVGVDETSITPEGRRALEDGDIGSIVYFNKSPRDSFTEISLTQFKQDLRAFNEEIITLITVQTGLTRAQLTGVASGETATAETIAQGGQTLRLSDMATEIGRYSDLQVEKLWKVIRQFVDLPTLELITGEAGVDPQTGGVKYSWLPSIDPDIDSRLQTGMFRFSTEVGSSQKADTALIIKRIEDVLNIMARTDVIALMQQQGKKVDLAELLRILLRQMPEVVKDTGKIIQDVNDMTQGTLPPELIQQMLGGGQGGQTAGSQQNAMAAQLGGGAPTTQGLVNEGANR